MRIAHVHWSYPPTTGGVESHLADITRLQRGRGHAVLLLTGERKPAREDDDEIVSSPLLDLDEARDASGRPGYREALDRFLEGILAAWSPDVVHGHNLHHFAPEPALVLDELRHRLGFALHHTFHETWPDLLHARPVYRGWDGNYAISRHIQEECAERIGFRPTLLSPGVDTQRFRPAVARTPNIPPVIVHPARLLPWKGVHVTVQALAILRNRGVRAQLILTDTQRIADWDHELDGYRHSIKTQITALGLEDRVELRGVPYAEMAALHATADVVVYPSIAPEPFGLVPVEAMAAGTPVVATRSGGIPESVLDQETGLLVDPNRPDELADALERLLADPALSRRMGEAGRRRVLRHFDLHRYLGTLHAWYQTGAPAPPEDP